MNFSEFKQKFNIKLNAQQEKAVENINGPTLLLAVPGSGKTTVIISRIGNMIYRYQIPAEKILTITFSVASAKDMSNRFIKVFGNNLADQVDFRTIHSLCVGIIKEYERIKGRRAFTLSKNIKQIIRELYIQETKEFPGENEIQDISQKITYCKNMILDEEAIKAISVNGIEFNKFYNLYEEYKREHKIMDFDDQLQYAHQILISYPEILKLFQNKYEYINVDEAQDTSYIQHCIIRLLADSSKNLFMVGDEDQSIYRFRGAFPKALLDFKDTYHDAKILLMETNYRSTPEIVNAASNFIKQNSGRTDKAMITPNSNGSAIRNTMLSHMKDQYKYLSEQSNYENCAILYRNNESAIPIIDFFERKNIKYNTKGINTHFFTHFVTVDICSFLKLCSDQSDIIAFEKIYYKIGCGINKSMLEKIIMSESAQKISVFDKILTFPKESEEPWFFKRIFETKLKFEEMKKMTPEKAILYIVNELGYNKHLLGKTKQGYSIQSFDQKLNTLLLISERCSNFDDFYNRLSFLKEKIDVPANKEGISLLTVHSSKGLEFNKVIIIDAINGQFPAEKNNSEEEDKSEIEEEVRLFYVAITRAKNELEFISAKERHFGSSESSTFIKNLFQNNCKDVDINPGKKVSHKIFGDGLIQEVKNDFIYIDFLSAGRKILSKNICLKEKLLEVIV